MTARKLLIVVGAIALLATGCDYIVLPPTGQSQAPDSTKGWTASVTGTAAGESGGVRIELAIRNDTGYWSAMEVAGGSVSLKTASGTTARCGTVFMSSGGHRIAPGFQLRGYTAGTKAEPKVQLLYAECSGVQDAAGATLSADYTYVLGDYDFYVKSKSYSAHLTAKVEAASPALTYPIGMEVDKLVEKAGEPIEGVNKCTVTLTDVARTTTGLELTWKTQNPTEYPVFLHIGVPPVIGSDGVIYGIYQSPHLADTPITLAGQSAQWKTSQVVPASVKGLYVLISVESRKQKMFVSHVIDITDK
jgi:hypothetical protein